MQPDELLEKPMSPMQYARSGLGTAEMNGKLIAAGKSRAMCVIDRPIGGHLYQRAAFQDRNKH